MHVPVALSGTSRIGPGRKDPIGDEHTAETRSTPGRGEERIDAALMEAIANGDRAAFRALYDRHSGRVFAVCLRVLYDRTAAEDALVDTFVEVWSRPGRFRPDHGRVAVYLALLARSRSIDRRRRDAAQRGREGVQPAATDNDSSVAGSFVSAQTEGGPEETVSLGDLRERIASALACLPPNQRRTLELCYLRGYSQRQAARILNEPLGTIKSRIAKGMIQMRRSLRTWNGDVP